VSTSLPFSTGAVSCYLAPMVHVTWVADDKFLKPQNAQSDRINVSVKIVWLSLCSSRTVH